MANRVLTIRDVWLALFGEAGMQHLPEQELASVVIDHRQAKAGSCFVALPGQRTDGHRFVPGAFANGAVLALVTRDEGFGVPVVGLDQPLATAPVGLPFCLRVADGVQALQTMATWWRQQFTPTVVAITGSVGKTSTKELTYSVLKQRFATLHNPGSLNNEIGLPLTLLALTDTHEAVVLEMGMYALGEIAHLCQIARPQIGVVTNVGPVHLERLGTMENIARAKTELVQALPPAPDGVAILNADDPVVKAMAGQTPARPFFYGLTPDCDLWASDTEGRGLEGIRFYLHEGGQSLQVRVPLLGRHSVHTALRAASVGRVLGMSWEEIVAGLQGIDAQLRLVAVPGINGATLLDDTYNASPASTIAALNLLAELGGRRVAVLGEMAELGAFEEEGHRLVGARAATVADVLVTVGKGAQRIADEAVAVGMPSDAVRAVDNLDAALVFLKEHIRPGDMVLVKGSRSVGMEALVTALTRSDADETAEA